MRDVETVREVLLRDDSVEPGASSPAGEWRYANGVISFEPLPAAFIDKLRTFLLRQRGHHAH